MNLRPIYGPGFRRMRKRLGPKRLEELRQKTISEQEAARAALAGEIVVSRDRTTYKDYPRTWVPPSKPGKK